MPDRSRPTHVAAVSRRPHIPPLDRPAPTAASSPTNVDASPPAVDRAIARAVAALAAFTVAEHAAWVTMLVIAYERGGIAETGVVSAALLLPAAVVAPLAARELHLPGAPSPLATGYAVQTVALALTTAVCAFRLEPSLVYLAGALVTMSAVCSRPAHHAFLAGRRVTDARARATVATGIATGGGQLAGPLLAAAMLATAGPALVFASCTVLLAVATGLVRGMSAVPSATSVPSVVPVPSEPVRGNGATSARASGRGGVSFDAVLLVAVLGVATMVLGTLEAIANEVSWRNGDGGAGAGVLLAATGAGLLMGAPLAGTIARRAGECRALRVGAGLAGLAVLGLGLRAGAVVSVVAFALVGTGLQTVTVSSWLLLHRRAAGTAVARTFGLVEAQQLVGNALGAGLTGVAVDRIGVWPVLVATSVVLPLASVPLSRRRLGRLATVVVPVT